MMIRWYRGNSCRITVLRQRYLRSCYSCFTILHQGCFGEVRRPQEESTQLTRNPIQVLGVVLSSLFQDLTLGQTSLNVIICDSRLKGEG